MAIQSYSIDDCELRRAVWRMHKRTTRTNAQLAERFKITEEDVAEIIRMNELRPTRYVKPVVNLPVRCPDCGGKVITRYCRLCKLRREMST